MKTITPAEHAARPKERQPVQPTYSQHDEGLIIRYSYAKPWPAMTAEQKCTMLGHLAADLRRLAEQMDNARSEIAAEELAA